MQCPLSGISGCLMAPSTLFSVIATVGLVFGVFSAFWPARSISLYQWIMERFNWKVAPIDGARELRNTRILGVALIPLSVAIFVSVFLRR